MPIQTLHFFVESSISCLKHKIKHTVELQDQKLVFYFFTFKKNPDLVVFYGIQNTFKLNPILGGETKYKCKVVAEMVSHVVCKMQALTN